MKAIHDPEQREVKHREMFAVYVIIAVVAGAAVGYLVRRQMAESKIRSAEQEAQRILEEARRDAEAKRG